MSADFVNAILESITASQPAVNASGNGPAIVWNDGLAAGSKSWAEHLATTGDRQHAPGFHTENIAWGGRCSGYDPKEPGYSLHHIP